MNVTIGQRELEMGGRYMTELRSSNDILHDTEALRQRMEEDGYLLLRDFHDRDTVLRTRAAALKQLAEKGRLAPDTNLEDGIIGPENKGAEFGSMPELLDIVNAPWVMSFFDRFLGGESMTFDYKWSRAVPRGGFSGAHYDVVYMGRGTKQLYTMWTPIGDISYEMGGLAVCLGSNRFDKIKATYGRMDVDRDLVAGWFSNDPVEIVDQFGGKWATTEFRAGDVMIFGMYLMHGSLTNTTDRFRLSCDTRYQLKSEPVDERWMGKKPKAHAESSGKSVLPIDEARKAWGV
ncbi:MAG: phytanoyl-CoA dioxygenase family protein [Paenibacillaceae bacterium]|nr:phytanoyl-CoA dioxygenase family protein [Paenibacillaceae bacterium]